MGGINFKPKLGATLITCVAIVVTLLLANWQFNRAQTKRQLQERFDRFSKEPAISLPSTSVDADQFLFRRVEVEGQFDPTRTIYLDNKVYRRIIGYQVITPLRIGNSSLYVLINRGWVAAKSQRKDLPPVRTPPGMQKITGIAMVPSQQIVELSAHTVDGKIWENLVLERYRERMNIDVQPIFIAQQNDIQDGLVRDWPRPDTGVDRHLGYAFQWLSLAVAILITYIVLTVRQYAKSK